MNSSYNRYIQEYSLCIFNLMKCKYLIKKLIFFLFLFNFCFLGDFSKFLVNINVSSFLSKMVEILLNSSYETRKSVYDILDNILPLMETINDEQVIKIIKINK